MIECAGLWDPFIRRARILHISELPMRRPSLSMLMNKGICRPCSSGICRCRHTRTKSTRRYRVRASREVGICMFVHHTHCRPVTANLQHRLKQLPLASSRYPKLPSPTNYPYVKRRSERFPWVTLSHTHPSILSPKGMIAGIEAYRLCLAI